MTTSIINNDNDNVNNITTKGEEEKPFWDKFWEKSPHNKRGSKKRPDNEKNVNDLIEEVAKRASFSKKDVEIILSTLRDVLGEWIVERIPFFWINFFKIYYCVTPDTVSYSPLSKTVIERKSRIYPKVKFSLIFNKIEKERNKNK